MASAHDLIVIGDVHGDGDRLLHVLQRLRLARGSPGRGLRWTGGTVALVLLGDVLDGRERVPGSRLSTRIGDFGAVRLLHELAAGAAADGGSVTCLLGNHEAMNAHGQFGYVHAADLAADGGAAGRAARAAPAGDVGRALARWKRVHVDNRVLLCHAGVHTAAAAAIAGPRDVALGAPGVGDYELLEHRQYAAPPASAHELAALDGLLRRCGCVAMVIGHNRVDAPARAWGGRVVLADAGLSRAFGGGAGTVHVLCVRPDGAVSDVAVRLPRELALTCAAG